MATTAAPPTAPIAKTEEAPLEINQQNATLYVSNIDWKIKKLVLKRALHTLFGRHGKILDIITLRHEGLRGQAWVIFAHLPAATAALQAEQGFTFFGKNLKIAYARETSDIVSKKNGTFVPKDRREKRERRATELLANKKRKMDEGTVTTVEDPSSLVEDDTVKEETEASAATTEAASSASTGMMSGETPVQNESPSNILFAESLPADCKEMMLAMLFRQYPGFKEVRVPRPGLAFAEYDDEPHATVALKSLNGFKLTTSDTLNLKYAKS